MTLTPKFVSDTNQRIWVYIPKVVLFCLCCAVLGAVIGIILFPGHPLKLALQNSSVLSLFLGVVIFSPVVETLMLAFLVMLLRKIFRSDRNVALASAAVWAVLHSLITIRWGFSVFVSFYMMTLCYLVWSRSSVFRALLITAAIHASINLVPSLYVVAHRYTEPNKALVPTPASVTPAADAPVAPDAGAAHL
jgi:hypothetical protein